MHTHRKQAILLALIALTFSPALYPAVQAATAPIPAQKLTFHAQDIHATPVDASPISKKKLRKLLKKSSASRAYTTAKRSLGKFIKKILIAASVLFISCAVLLPVAAIGFIIAMPSLHGFLFISSSLFALALLPTITYLYT